MARNDPQVNLRMPADLKDRLDSAAVENKRSLTAEIVARLEGSWDAEGYQDLAELFLETLKDNQQRATRELEEYRQMASTIRFLRYIIERMKVEIGDDMPEDITLLLGLLSKNPTVRNDDPMAIVAEMVDSAEREERLLADDASGKEAEDRRRKIESLLRRLHDRVSAPLL